MGPVARYLGPWVPGAAAVAGPGPRRRSRADRGGGHRRPQAHHARFRAAHLPAGLDRVGVRIHLPRDRQPGRRQRSPHPPRAAARLGGQRAGRTGHGAADPRADPAGFQRLAVRRHAGLARRPDRPRRLRSGGAGRAERRARRARSRSCRGARTPRRSRPTWSRSRCWNPPPTDSATTCGPARSCRRRPLLVDRANMLTLTAPEMTVLIGGLRALTPMSARRDTASSPTGPGR